jgi:DNA-directed RNA polymerase subunit RPC12/RpoP
MINEEKCRYFAQTNYDYMVIEAKCPQCGKRAEIKEDMSEVECKQCGFRVLYDEYIEIMKGRAVSMADDFQMDR